MKQLLTSLARGGFLHLASPADTDSMRSCSAFLATVPGWGNQQPGQDDSFELAAIFQFCLSSSLILFESQKGRESCLRQPRDGVAEQGYNQGQGFYSENIFNRLFFPPSAFF